MSIATADLLDRFGESVDVLDLALTDFGGRRAFSGPVTTLKTYEDNTRVREILEAEGGRGRVLVIDGAGSTRAALVGDQLGALAADRGWSGIVVFGCVRDAAALRSLDVGVRALGTCPRRTEKRGGGWVDVPITFGGVTFRPGAHLYADDDGIVVAPGDLDLTRP